MSVRGSRRKSPASVLAIGSANPPNVFYQNEYPDFFFNVTDSNHMVHLKEKFQRMCDKSGITKRYFYSNEEILKANPCLLGHSNTSFNARQDIVVAEVPKLGKEAAVKAIKEWGQPKSKITHLVFCTSSGLDMPGADCAVIKLLGLRPSVKRLMMYQQGGFAGGTVMRVAKDMAENNQGARVLIVCCEITVVTFRGPNETHPDSLVGQALFSDGAAAIIVGSDPVPNVERPLFEIHWTGSNILPESRGAMNGHLREMGLSVHLAKDVPEIISNNMGGILKDAFEESFKKGAAPSFNDIFWITHPGGPAILDMLEQKLHLKSEKMAPSRAVLSDFGNMSSPTVLFIMDYIRKKSVEKKLSTTGQGFEWGLLLAFGPGITCETVLLKSMPLS